MSVEAYRVPKGNAESLIRPPEVSLIDRPGVSAAADLLGHRVNDSLLL